MEKILKKMIPSEKRSIHPFGSFTGAVVHGLTAMEYLRHRFAQIRSSCRNHFLVILFSIATRPNETFVNVEKVEPNYVFLISDIWTCFLNYLQFLFNLFGQFHS